MLSHALFSFPALTALAITPAPGKHVSGGRPRLAHDGEESEITPRGFDVFGRKSKFT